MTEWLRVFAHEISRRRRIYNENKDLFKKIHSINPKGLLDSETCGAHVWVPATHLMIHDAAAKSIILGGLKTRGFSEAKPYKENNNLVVPQMCWRCDATRDHSAENVSVEERHKRLVALRPKKHRGRKSYTEVESCFDELFG